MPSGISRLKLIILQLTLLLHLAQREDSVLAVFKISGLYRESNEGEA